METSKLKNYLKAILDMEKELIVLERVHIKKIASKIIAKEMTAE